MSEAEAARDKLVVSARRQTGRVDDLALGRLIRALRIKRGWRQVDLGARSRRSRSMVSRAERGRLGNMSVEDLRAIALELDVRVAFVATGRGGELDRLLSARHSAMHEVLAKMLADLPDWIAAPEVTFSVWGERGTIDILAWHPSRRALLVIELKTEVTDVQHLVGSVDRYRRLAPTIAGERGWDSPATVSCWVVVARSRTNERRLAEHAAMLRAAFPDDARRMTAWLRDPVGSRACLSTLALPGSRLVPRQRVRLARARHTLTR